MKTTLAILTVSALFSVAEATTPTLTSITQPLYFLGSAEDVQIKFIETPKIVNKADPLYWTFLFQSPTKIEGSDEDLNLISLYGLAVNLIDSDSKGTPTLIVIDSSKAAVPERYPFTIEEVVEAAVKAVRIEFPDEAFTKIKVQPDC